MADFRNDIYAAASDILGELAQEQEDLLHLLIQGVCTFMDQRLKEGITNSDCRSAYISACTLYSVSYLRCLDAEQLSGFTAGTLSLSFDSTPSAAIQMADRLMAPWLKSESALRGVRG